MILLLSDDDLFLTQIRTIVVANTNVEIRVARNGDEAIKLLKTFFPKLMLVDADMRRRKWGDMLGELYRSSDATSVIMLLTGLAKPEIGVHELLRVGGDAIIDKKNAARLLPLLIKEAMES